ncbi:hypothetical protein AOQ88_00520 [Candidatus Riesia sp. GBBU]|nr:hypothetical protein AOQ88_00520 [Candidatus Riesia sp. GBBU]
MIKVSGISKKKNNDTHLAKVQENKIFGFWTYMMSDLILFICFLSTYSVLSENSLYFLEWKNIHISKLSVIIKTFLLMFSNLLINLVCSFKTKKEKITYILFFSIFLLTVSILFSDFFIYNGYCNLISKDALFSSFFTIMFIHIFHILLGSIWILILAFQIYKYKFDIINITNLNCLKIFWNFLNLMWIFMISIVFFLEKVL